MALTPEQRKVLAHILRVAKQKGASPKEVKAAIETGLVESNLTNPSAMTDHDSQGWRQERASLYKDPTNLDASIGRFFDETSAVKGKYGRAGDLAAAVQRPAAQYRGRYQGRSQEAEQLLGGSGGSAAAKPSGATGATTTTTTPGVDNSAQRGALIASFLGTKGADPVSFAMGIRGLQDTPGQKVTTTSRSKLANAAAAPSPGGSSQGGVGTFDGKKVAAWMVPLLTYARAKGWKGTVNSGVRTDAEQTAIYKSGVRPAAVPKSLGGAGSKHEQTGFLKGAIDVSDAATLNRILQAKHSRLKYAGAKDPVHFSVPNPDGSY